MLNNYAQFEYPGLLTIEEEIKGFPIVKIRSELAAADISLYGGQVLHYQPVDEEQPMIWLSEASKYASGKAIRGGIPICWPWFGDHPQFSDLPAHGFARNTLWDLNSIEHLDNGSFRIVLTLPCSSLCQSVKSTLSQFNLSLQMHIEIGNQLIVDLITKNNGDTPFTYSEALHTYYYVSDVKNIVIEGLEQTTYIDKLDTGQQKLQENSLQLTQATDRVYLNSTSDVKIIDQSFNREILISKQNSLTTVVWNPWLEKASSMADMTSINWSSMICVEVANAAENSVTVEPGSTNHLLMVSAFRSL